MIGVTEEALSRLAEYFYEESRFEPNIRLSVNTADREALVRVLRRAIERTQQDALADFQESLDKVQEAYEAIGTSIAEALKNAVSHASPEAKHPPVWTVEYLHEDCPQCEDLAERAIQQASEQGRDKATVLEFVRGTFQLAHKGTATRGLRARDTL